MTRWTAWFVEQRPPMRRQVQLVGFSMVLFLLHVVAYSTWQIEDAAITYAFARNAAMGEGFVLNPGGTWVEGFSNPTLTLLLTVTTWLGLPVFGVSKVMGVGAGLLTLPLSWRWAKRLQLPDDFGSWPALAPLGLALSGPFVQWSAAGLENGLFNLFLVAGVVWLLEEGDERRVPWSAVPLGLLSITRPDAPMYAGVIVLVLAPRALRAGGARWLVGFFAVAATPFVAWHAWSYWAFAWELPNTAYAKSPSERARPFKWGHRSWTYLRRWALESVHGFLVPLFVFGHTGIQGWRARIGTAALLLGALVTLPGLAWPRLVLSLPDEPAGVMPWRIGIYAVVVLMIAATNWGRRGAVERGLAGILVICTFAFCVGTGGDWMRGYRWISFATVPLAVLAVEGARVASMVLVQIPRLPRWLRVQERLLLLLLLPLWIGGVGQTVDVLNHIDTSPFDVQRRALYHRALADRMHIDHVTHMEIDMGGNMMSAGFEITDIAGLMSVPIAHHGYKSAFIESYIRRERRPLLVHIHGGWVAKSRVVGTRWFKREWVPVPGYAHSAGVWHMGTHVRRDAFVWKDWPHKDGRTAQFGRIALEGLDLPAPLVHPGGELFVEVGWSAERAPTDFRAYFFLSKGDTLIVKELPPAYDWIVPSNWKASRIYTSRYSLPLPVDLEPGSYSIGLLLVSEGVHPRTIPARPEAEVPVFAKGEVRWEEVVMVRPRDEVLAVAKSRHDAAQAFAKSLDCESAASEWAVSRRHLSRSDPWQGSARQTIERSLATCWALLAEEDGKPDVSFGSPPRQAALWIQRARRLDHHAPEVERVSVVLADAWEAEGRRAQDRGDVTGAWRGWRDALLADPSRSGLRRQIESVRAERLGLK